MVSKLPKGLNTMEKKICNYKRECKDISKGKKEIKESDIR